MSNSFEEKASSDFSKSLRRKVRKALKTLEYRGITWHEMAPNDIRKQTNIPPLTLFVRVQILHPLPNEKTWLSAKELLCLFYWSKQMLILAE